MLFIITCVVDQMSKSLDEINEQRIEKVNRLKIAEKERDNLSGSKLEAEAFIEKEKDIRRKKNILYQIMENGSNEGAAELTAKHERAVEKLALEKGKLADSEKRLSVIQGEYEKVKAEHNKVESELQKCTTVRLFCCFLFLLSFTQCCVDFYFVGVISVFYYSAKI